MKSRMKTMVVGVLFLAALPLTGCSLYGKATRMMNDLPSIAYDEARDTASEQQVLEEALKQNSAIQRELLKSYQEITAPAAKTNTAQE